MIDIDKTIIYAEQYLECSANNEGSWDVYLIIENVSKKPKDKIQRLKYSLGNFRTMDLGDLYAESLRYFYDKTVYKFEYN
jgi:hypothetical protein